MSYYGVQVTLIFILTFMNAEAKKPPGYVATPREYDPNPPKYEYGYKIQDAKATHGKDEQRDGIYAQGRYYVEKGAESSQNVKYFADDWGYHPVVEYSNKGPYSKSSTNFVLGEEAIKLKNNQKSIPQDPSDPGKAENLAKLDPSNQNQPQPQQYVIQNDPSEHQQSNNQPQLFFQQPQQVIIENQSEKPTVILHQQDQPQILVQQPVIIQQPQVEIRPTPTPSSQQEIVVSNQPLNVDQHVPDENNQLQLIKIEDPQTAIFQSTPRPEILLQDLPNIKIEHSQSQSDDVDTQSQSKDVLIQQSSETRSQPKPLFYYVESQQGQNELNILPSATGNQLTDQTFQQQINIQPISTEKQLFYPVQQYQPVVQHQQIEHSREVLQPTSEQNAVILQKGEQLPQPQASIYPEKEQNVFIENQDQQILVGNDIVDIRGGSGQLLETAALTKIPNKIVESSSRYREFGTKLNPKTHTRMGTKNLIESTKNLVSGTDVLNINAAISQSHSSNDEIGSGSLNSLLNQYVTPSIVNNPVNIDLSHLKLVSSTTVAPAVTTEKASLLNEPIVAAEAPDDSEHKPVIERTDENRNYFYSTSRSSLISSTTTPANLEKEILVTPRPVSSKFLAPITAGVQLQHIDDPIFEDTKTIETHEGYQKKNKVLVQVQKTIPYYLGMYEYPLGYAAQYRGHNMTGREKAIENIELGKTLLYFPEPDSPKSEHVHEVSKAEPPQEIPEVTSNYLTPQLPRQENLVEIDQQALQGEQQLFIEKGQTQQQAFEHTGATESKVEQQFFIQTKEQQEPGEVTKILHQPYPVPYPVVQRVPYPVEEIVDRQIHIPVQVTKYVDRPYPVKVPVPYPQPYPVEKVVKEPYPVPVHVQVPVPHPVPVEKVVKEPYPVPVHIQVPVPQPVPVEKIVERQVPVPYYVDRVVEKQVPHYINRPYPVGVPVHNHLPVQQAYLLHIPGLFSQQKYSTLVHNEYQPQKLQFQYAIKGNQNKVLDQQQYLAQNQGVNPYSYASQINQYLPAKQEFQLNRGQIPPKLKKLNLLVFPQVNVPVNLPPVTKNPYDLQHSHSYQSFRHSNAQLDNGYLPPVPQNQNDCDHNDHLQASASSTSNNYNVNNPQESFGLVPPKLQSLEDSGKFRSARSYFDDKSIRLEYGFMPPLIPSLEIDEHGQPIEKDDNKN